MEKKRIHLYTFIQLGFFAALYGVKTYKAIAIAFPFFILLCIPARLYLLPRFFDGWELALLDGEDDEINEWLEKKEEVLQSIHYNTDGESEFDNESELDDGGGNEGEGGIAKTEHDASDESS